MLADVVQPAKPFTVDLSEGEDEDEEDEPAQPVKAKGKGKAAEPETGDEDEEESEDEFAADRAVADDEDENEDEDEDEDDDEDDDGEEDEEDEDDDDDEEPSDAELPSDLSDDDDEPDTLNGLDSFVDQLDAAQRKTREDKSVVAEAAKTKRRVLPVSSANGRAAGMFFRSPVRLLYQCVMIADGLVQTASWTCRLSSPRTPHYLARPLSCPVNPTTSPRPRRSSSRAYSPPLSPQSCKTDWTERRPTKRQKRKARNGPAR